MYAALFLGLPLVGLWLYVRLCRRMVTANVVAPPVVPLLVVFAAYGAVLLFAVSAIFEVWSGMHSIAVVALLLVGLPWLVVQGVGLLHGESRSAYHRGVAVLSLAFPVVLVALYRFSVALDR